MLGCRVFFQTEKMAYKIRRKQNVNIGKVVTKVVSTLIALWAGGVIITELGGVMNGTMSPFYKGLSLIGWTIGDFPAFNATHYYDTCDASVASYSASAPGYSTCITDTTGAGILAVVGIIGIASIVMEFVDFKAY